MNNDTVTVTQKENKLLTWIVDSMYAEKGFSDIDKKDIRKAGFPQRTYRGVLSSLVKKNLVIIDHVDNLNPSTIFLTPQTEGLVEEWLTYDDCAQPVTIIVKD